MSSRAVRYEFETFLSILVNLVSENNSFRGIGIKRSNYRYRYHITYRYRMHLYWRSSETGQNKEFSPDYTLIKQPRVNEKNS